MRKHGAFAAAEGRLRVTWGLRPGPQGERLRLEWLEEGIEVPGDAPPAGGYGRELIEHALPYSMGAETSYSIGRDRVVCTIELPRDRLTGDLGS